MAKKKKDQTSKYLISIVTIVGVVAVAMLLSNSLGNSGDLSGQVIKTITTSRTTAGSTSCEYDTYYQKVCICDDANPNARPTTDSVSMCESCDSYCEDTYGSDVYGDAECIAAVAVYMNFDTEKFTLSSTSCSREY